MDYSEALSFSFRDEDWIKKLAIGGFIAFVGLYTGLILLLGPLVVGYYIGVMRNVYSGEKDPLPDWSELSKLIVDGIFGSIIILIHLVVIGGICAIVIVYLATNPFTPEFERTLGIVLTSIATFLALVIFTNLGLIQYAITDNITAAFSISAMVNFVKQQLGNFLGVVIFSSILNFMLLLAGLGILSPFTNFWGLIVQAHLFGQCARERQPDTSVVQSA
jgi:hypothetical protein